jgi:hypothetical protein
VKLHEISDLTCCVQETIVVSSQPLFELPLPDCANIKGARVRNFLSVQKVFSFSISFFLAAILALLAGCGPGTPDTSSATGTFIPGITMQLYDAKGAVATSVSPGVDAIATAIVTDDFGKPVPGTVVTFVVTDTTLATVSQTTALTDKNGLAQVTVSATGNGVGATSVSASASVTTSTGTVVTAAGQTSFAVTAGSGTGPTPLPTLTMQLTNSAGTPITAISSGVQGKAKVTIKDAAGAVLPNIIVMFSVADPTLVGITPATTALTDSNGVAQVSLTAKAPGATSVTASATVNGTPLSGTTNFSVSTSAPSLSLSLSATTVTAAAPVIVTANLRDGAGVVMPNVLVTFTVANTQYAAITSSATTDAFGNATATLTAVATGSTSVSASAPVPNFPPNNLVTGGPVSFSVVTTSTAASLSLSATPTTVKTDNTNSSTVTVTALDSGNATVSGVVVNLSADTGIVSPQTVTTGANGKATFTFSSGTASKANRTATITATAGVTAHLPIQITGSTLTDNASGTTIPDDGTNPVTMTFTAKDAGGNAVPGITLALTKPTGVLTTLTSSSVADVTSGTTDTNGQLIVYVKKTTAGLASGNVTADWLGTKATAPINVTSASLTFGISQSQLNSDPPIANPTAVAMQIGDSLVVLVKAPAPIANVIFATTLGSWNGSGTSLSVAVGGPACGAITPAADEACATLTTTTAGLANVQVYDAANSTTSDSMTVSMTATTPYKITLQASPDVVGKCVGTTCPYSTLVATVTDINNQPVGNAQVLFSILNQTGGGESVSPVEQTTANVATSTLALGQARAQFTSGSLSSGALGVQIRAQVQGYPAVATGTSPSGNDATITIGGTAASISFAPASTVSSSPDDTSYIYNITVYVTDSAGHAAPEGTQVSLSVWPIAWSTGTAACGSPTATYFNEDVNENGYLDGQWNGVTGEDGMRADFLGVNPTTTGTFDNLITPPSAAAGVVPGNVTTDASGAASFTLIYPKASAIWIVDRLRASTFVLGSEGVSQIEFRLGYAQSDYNNIDVTKCFLPFPPFNY